MRKLVLSLIGVLFLFPTYVFAGTCDGVVFDAYCPGTCVKTPNPGIFSCVERGNKAIVRVADRVYLRLKRGYVARNFVLEDVYCVGNRCSKPYSDDGRIFYKIKSKKRVIKGTVPEGGPFPKRLGGTISGPGYIYFDVFPNRGSKGFSAGRGEGFMIKGTFRFEVVKK